VKKLKGDFQKKFVGPKRKIHFLFRQDGKASSRFKNGEGGLLINKPTTALMPPNVLHKTSKTWMDINDIYDYLSICYRAWVGISVINVLLDFRALVVSLIKLLKVDIHSSGTFAC